MGLHVVLLLLLVAMPLVAHAQEGNTGQPVDPFDAELANLGMTRANPNSSVQPMTVTPSLIPMQPGMATPPNPQGNDGYEDITSVTMGEGSPSISTSVPGGKAAGAPKVEWTFSREGEAFGGKNRTLNNGLMTTEANTDGPNGEGLYTMPGVSDPNDARCGTTPAWKPGRYSIGNHSVRRVEYEAKDADTGEPTTKRKTIESVGSADIVIYDTTPPALQLMMKQESSNAQGWVRLREAAENGVDKPIGDGTIHQAILEASGTGFDEMLKTSGEFSFPVTVKMGDNDIQDVGSLIEGIASGSNDPVLVEARTFGFHVFEDTPLTVTIRASDNFSDYKKEIKFITALVDENGNVYRDAAGNPIKWDQTQGERVDKEGNSLDEGQAAEEAFFTKTIALPFYSVESEDSLYEIKANYPLRTIEPDETQLDQLCRQTKVYILLEAADDNGCYPQGMSSNLARLKVPVYIHDITPVCEGDTGITVTFSGRNIQNTITIIEDPDTINQDTALGPKSIKFIVRGAHLVTDEHCDEGFEIDWTETLTFEEDDIISKTDFENLIDHGKSYGMKNALIVPENTRLQIGVSCDDNYSLSKMVGDREIKDGDGNPFVRWQVQGMESFDSGVLESPSMVNFQFANYREGFGLLSHVKYRYMFVFESRDKAGNEITFKLPIYILDTKYQVQHIMETSNPE